MVKRPIPARTRLAARSIGENLQTWRRLRGITAQELADKANVSRATISRLENGDPSVAMATFLTVCTALGVLDGVVKATDPFETDYGRLRADQEIPQRVRN